MSLNELLSPPDQIDPSSVPVDATPPPADLAGNSANDTPAPSTPLGDNPTRPANPDDFTHGIPSSTENPMLATFTLPWDEASRHDRDEQQKWYDSTLRNLNLAILNWPAFARQNNIQLADSADQEAAHRQYAIDAFVTHLNGGQPPAGGDIGMQTARRTVATGFFNLPPDADDNALFSAIETEIRSQAADFHSYAPVSLAPAVPGQRPDGTPDPAFSESSPAPSPRSATTSALLPEINPEERQAALYSGLSHIGDVLTSDQLAALEAQAHLTSDPDGYKAYAVNHLFLTQNGIKFTPVTYPQILSTIGHKYFGIPADKPVTDRTFYQAASISLNQKLNERLRSEFYPKITAEGMLSPSNLRNLSDDTSGLGNDALRETKNFFADIFETANAGVRTAFMGLGGPKYELPKLNDALGEQDLLLAYDKADPFSSERKAMLPLIESFQKQGIFDGVRMMNILHDSVKKFTWDSTTDDDTRVLTDGAIALNPKFLALPDGSQGLDAIEHTTATPADKQRAELEYHIDRAATAKQFHDSLLKYGDEDYLKHVEACRQNKVTDPEEVFFSWDGLTPDWTTGKWQQLRDTVQEGGRGLYRTGQGLSIALDSAFAWAYDKIGYDAGKQRHLDDMADEARSILNSQDKSSYINNIATASDLRGPLSGTLVETGSSLVEMLPYLLLPEAEPEAAAAETAAKLSLRELGMTGSFFVQGYTSIQQAALDNARERNRQNGLGDLTNEQIQQTLRDNQGPAVLNGAQGVLLSKLLPEGKEAALLGTLAEKEGAASLRSVITSFAADKGRDGLRAALNAARPELYKILKGYGGAFADDYIQGGINKYIEGVILRLSGADPNMTWDRINEESWSAAWSTGVFGTTMHGLRRAFGSTTRQPGSILPGELDQAVIDPSTGRIALPESNSGLGRTEDASTTAFDTRDPALAPIPSLQLASVRKAQEIGALPQFVRIRDGWEIRDSKTNELLGHAATPAEAWDLALRHNDDLTSLSADHVAYLFSQLQAIDKTSVPGNTSRTVTTTEFHPSENQSATAAFADPALIRERRAAIEKVQGGDGSIADAILGDSTTHFVAKVRKTINRLWNGSSIIDVFHEETHGFWREALATGRLTREDAISALRRIDQSLAGKTTPVWETNAAGERVPARKELRFLPSDDSPITDTILDEAVARLAEMELLRTRSGGKYGTDSQGFRNVESGLISKNLSSLARLAPGAAGKFSTFLETVRSYWGVTFAQALALKKAKRDGNFDEVAHNDFLDKLYGKDSSGEDHVIPDKSTKPRYSPNVKKWLGKGGTIDNEWTHISRHGDVVPYPNGFPDFAADGHVIIDLPYLQSFNRESDIAGATEKNGGLPLNATWHHHESGVKMQAIPTRIHALFTHWGSIGIKNHAAKSSPPTSK